jgi:alpha-mannosidase
MLAALSLFLVVGDPTQTLALLEQLAPEVDKRFTVPISTWRFARPDFPGGEKRGLDDSSWPTVSPGFSWKGENTNVWFRAHVTLPDFVAGQSIAGHTVRLQMGVDDDGELYLNGQLKEAFHWDDCSYTLTRSAAEGQEFLIAVRGKNGPGDGQLRSANLVIDMIPELRRYVAEARFVEQLEPMVSDGERAELQRALAASLGEIQGSDCSMERLGQLRDELDQAAGRLKAVASITKKADVYYIGHAHIDMNWLWTWPETIDVCHRTWNSAMNLMDEFPDFAFVQSQPGAYVPIQEQFPDEFSRMQAAVARGQWDPVSGLWDESDTDIPSGEGLARSLFLGQRFFKKNFGRYATTGWLPDSFGHSWQMPQLLQLVGIDSYYHMRCGNGLPFTWWESPDGSRVLKANTVPYNSDVQLNQLLEPWDEVKRTGIPKMLVVFGVGDHGGGPTREEILQLEQFKSDPVLPNVHMTGIDGFFGELRKEPKSADLPVVDQDLQYVFEGCYTTHADLKKALRSSENSLYTAEAMSSLAAMNGAAYPSETFLECWAPTAFAQFHDIACGSAIHSTYEWMLKQLRPETETTRELASAAVKKLTASVDTTRGTGPAIVVWNSLSFSRDDVTKAQVANAEAFHSVVDGAGHRFAAQADKDGMLEFVARGVPGFGHRVYFASKAAGPSDGLVLGDSDGQVSVGSPKVSLRIDKRTGAISNLTYKPDGWNLFGDSKDANTFQVLGDSGSAWDINYTGESHQLMDGADVKVVQSGPVFDQIEVTHEFGSSKFTQDITVYGALDRVDVPTSIDWHEHGKLVKVCLPAQEEHGVARASIPYGSIERPTDREVPGQKWMDWSDETVRPVVDARTVDLSGALNSDASGNFDGDGWGFDPSELPGSGLFGSAKVPFAMPGGSKCVACGGQSVSLPSVKQGDTLFLLGASAPDGKSGGIRFVMADGSVKTQTLDMNDWVIPSFGDKYQPGKVEASNAHLWITSVKVPDGDVRSIQLPYEPRMRLFGATLARSQASDPVHGLTVLNDCKYGFDVAKGVFRLTVLRSSHDPDPNPDEGLQNFTYSLYPHSKGWRESGVEQQGLGLNIPLQAVVTDHHRADGVAPLVSVSSEGNHVVAGALKHAEDGKGFVLRVFETQGRSGQARIVFDRPIKVEETDILERPLPPSLKLRADRERRALEVHGKQVDFEIGHDQIVTLRVTFKGVG